MSAISPLDPRVGSDTAGYEVNRGSSSNAELAIGSMFVDTND